jgi:hypothetical protein
LDQSIRADVAFVTGRLLSNRTAFAVYDCSQSKYISFSGSVEQSEINVYDHDERCFFCGKGDGHQYSFYHYGGGHHVSLGIEGNQFRGYDYGTGFYFSGRVNGNRISLYDYQTGLDFEFSV